MDVMIGYATAHGSTREIADHVAARLRRHGLDATGRDMAAPGPPGDHDAYVLGSAIHNQRWLPAADAFLRENAPELAARPLWLFSVGMPAALRSPLRLLSRGQPLTIASGFPAHLAYRDHRVFSGVVRDDHFAGPAWLAMWAMTSGPGDYRDWPEIDQWTDAVAHVLTTLPALTTRARGTGERGSGGTRGGTRRPRGRSDEARTRE